MEKRGDGELELAGVRAGGGGVLGVWGRRTGERARVLECGGSPGADAHKRRGAGALPRACHGGGDVAAAKHDRGSVAREKGLQHEWSGARGLRGCRVWRWRSRRWPAALLGGGRRRSLPAVQEAERERGGR